MVIQLEHPVDCLNVTARVIPNYTKYQMYRNNCNDPTSLRVCFVGPFKTDLAVKTFIELVVCIEKKRHRERIRIFLSNSIFQNDCLYYINF